MTLTVEYEREEEGRWLADLVKPEGISTLVAEVARLIAVARIAFSVAIDPPALNVSTKALLERLQFIFEENKEAGEYVYISSRHLSSTLETNAVCWDRLQNSKRLVEFTPQHRAKLVLR